MTFDYKLYDMSSHTTKSLNFSSNLLLKQSLLVVKKLFSQEQIRTIQSFLLFRRNRGFSQKLFYAVPLHLFDDFKSLDECLNSWNIAQQSAHFGHSTEQLLHPTGQFGHATEQLLHTIGQFSHTTEQLLHTIGQFGHTTKQLLHPIEQFSHPIEQLLHPIEQWSEPTGQKNTKKVIHAN